jgi:hypothetical protein
MERLGKTDVGTGSGDLSFYNLVRSKKQRAQECIQAALPNDLSSSAGTSLEQLLHDHG